MRIEARQIILQLLRRIALGIDGDEQRADAVGVGPELVSTSETSNSVVGQMSGQCVKPKKTRNGLPLRDASVTVLPS